MMPKEGPPAYLTEGHARFVMVRKEARAATLMSLIEDWGQTHPSERLSVRGMARMLGIRRETVSATLNAIIQTNPDFPDPRRKTAAPLSAGNSHIGNVTKGLAYRHPEAFIALGTVIRRSGVHLGSARARILLEQAGFRVRRIRENGSTRYIVSARNESSINSHLQHLLHKDSPKKRTYSLERLTRGFVEHHPEVYITLGGVLRQAGLDIGSRRVPEIAELLKKSGFHLGTFTEHVRSEDRQTQRYYLLRSDLIKIRDFIWKNRSKFRIFEAHPNPPRKSA